jgi:hypothetical protein
MEIDTLFTKFSSDFLAQVSPASVLDVSAGSCQRPLVDEGMIRNQMGTYTRSDNSRGARVILYIHPIRMKIKIKKYHSILKDTASRTIFRHVCMPAEHLVKSLHLYALNHSRMAEQIFIKCDTGEFY